MFDWLLSTDFASRASGGCSGWTESLSIVDAAFSIGTAIPYFVIPAVMVVMIRRGLIPGSSLHYQVAIFVVACGIVHAVQAVTNFVPVYHLEIVFAGVRAAVSLYTMAFAVRYFRQVQRAEERR